MVTSRALYFLAPFQVGLVEEELAPPGPGQVGVDTLLSALSPGTELLIYRGRAPRGLAADVSLPALAGATLEFPLKYGYAAVGRVAALGPGVDPAWEGRLVFAFQPHAERFVADLASLQPLPPGVAPEEAVFLPNLETALTLTLDGRPLIGERVVVFGQGIVGLLLTTLLARFPLEILVTVDPCANRRLASETAGAHLSLDPAAPDVRERLAALLTRDGADLAFEVSGRPQGLNAALECLGFHGRVVIGSWYGEQVAHLNLGGEFHRRRQQLLSSQVSTIAPELSGRFSKPRLLALAWRLLPELGLRRFITHRLPLEQAQEAYRLLDERPEEAIQVVFTYGAA
ncbi:MAG: zinc-binding alcohol dehydrogenase [Syntrophobacterales bacterium]|nr:zinc-binding alcohol dehydrogenase [Syntrophobacterales bacterium]